MQRIQKQRTVPPAPPLRKTQVLHLDNGLPSPPVDDLHQHFEKLSPASSDDDEVSIDMATPSSSNDWDEESLRQKIKTLQEEKHRLFQAMSHRNKEKFPPQRQQWRRQQQQQQQQKRQRRRMNGKSRKGLLGHTVDRAEVSLDHAALATTLIITHRLRRRPGTTIHVTVMAGDTHPTTDIR
ncbi:hypothetical protein DFQ29_007644 [Apophysomyces sp. BC1021]|nr:hypothetical protein DFQ29_007644 [Apophysomyces sp. BC1021]